MSGGSTYGWKCAETPAVSALSPSGASLAFAIEQTNAPTDENVVESAIDSRDDLHRPASPRPQDSLISSDHGHQATPPLIQYRVVITSSGDSRIPSKSAAATIDKTSEERSLASSSIPSSSSSSTSAANGEVATCTVKASVTTLQWLDESHLAVGLQDGTVTIIARRKSSKISSERPSSSEIGLEWTPTLSRCFHRAQTDESSDEEDKARRVVCIRLSGEGLGAGAGGATGAARGSELTLWVLYGDRVVVCVSVEGVIALARQRSASSPASPSSATSNHTTPNDNGEDPSPPPPGPTFVKIQLEGQEEVLDVVACPASAGLFEVRSDRHSHVILAAGVSPSLAFYPIGSETRSFGLASIAWAVASHVTSLTVGVIDGIFGFVTLRGRGKKPENKNGGGGSEDGDGREESPPPLVLRWDGGLQDGWRKVTRLCLDPSGRLAAAADGFGRVMLVDCATRQILRMWKGVRHAECGWLEVAESWEGRRVASVGQERPATDTATTPPGEAVATPVIGLYLAILAPLRGRVELWRMRHGPCVRVIPAPTGARLLTSRPSLVASDASLNADGRGGEKRGSHAGGLTSCYLLSGGGGTGGTETRLRLNPLLMEEADLADLPSRFSREPMVDNDYHLRKIAAAVAEIRAHGGAATTGEREKVVGERERLPAGQAAREEALFQLLSQLESLEPLARATASLEKGSAADGAILLSVSFQRRLCALCRERADAATAAAAAAAAAPTSAAATEGGYPTTGLKDGSDPTGTEAAISTLRFRAAAFELYTVLEAVELQPAGAGGEDENGDPAFLPPGKRGWKHAFLCEEAAGWADVVREASGTFRPVRAPSVELPDFQEFLETVSVVLEGREADPRPTSHALSDRGKAPPLLQFVTNADERSGSKERGGSEEVHTTRSRRSSRGSESPSELSSAGNVSTEHKGSVTPADRSAEHAVCRERLVGWLFRPLLSDAFAMASLTQALSILGLGGKEQVGVLVRDMAAWFLTLPVDCAADITVGREAQNCPVLRWLKGVILLVESSSSSAAPTAWNTTKTAGSEQGREFENEKTALGKNSRTFDLFGDPIDGDAASDGEEGSTSDGTDNGSTSSVTENGLVTSGAEESDEQLGEQDAGSDREGDAEEVLRPMYEACAASERLENASMLSVVVAEALAACREKLEESSLGQVALGGEETWTTLARRLRVCLFVDHRLHWGMRTELRERASVRRFQEGKASLYALIAKDQLMSFTDLSFAACSSRESNEVEASARSQRETAEAKAAGRPLTSERPGALGSSALTDGIDAGGVVAAAPSLVDVRMDEHWRAVQAMATRAGNAPITTALPGIAPATLGPAASTGFSGGGSANKASPRGRKYAHRDSDAAGDTQLTPTGAPSETRPTTLFFMRSHAQPIVLACHRTRWLVLSWASTGPTSVESLERATDPESIMEAAKASEAAVRRLSLAVDHLSYLRTAKPFLAGCIAYSLWEHGGVRSHVRDLARGVSHDRLGKGDDDSAVGVDNAGGGGGVVEEGRPAREAFLAAAEEFLRVEALFVGRSEAAGRDRQGGRGGNAGKNGGQGSDVSFMSLLTEGAMRRCGWPGAWDQWIEECLRDAQVHPPLQSAVAAHMTLLRALRVSTVCGLAEKETLGLFEKGHSLCAESSLRNERFVAASTPSQPRDSGRRASGGKEVELVLARRESYIRRALEAIVPRPAQSVYRLALDFGVSEEAVRGWHCLILLRRGHDVLGEETLSQIFSLQDLAGDVLTVMRLRLKRFLDFLEASPGSSRGLLANLDADTCQWVRAAKDPEAVSRVGQAGGVQSEKEQGEPLRSTHGVLLCLARALPRDDSRHKLQANALVTLVGTMLQHLGSAGTTFRR